MNATQSRLLFDALLLCDHERALAMLLVLQAVDQGCLMHLRAAITKSAQQELFNGPVLALYHIGLQQYGHAALVYENSAYREPYNIFVRKQALLFFLITDRLDRVFHHSQQLVLLERSHQLQMIDLVGLFRTLLKELQTYSYAAPSMSVQELQVALLKIIKELDQNLYFFLSGTITPA